MHGPLLRFTVARDTGALQRHMVSELYLYSHSLVQFAIIITLKNIYNNT